MGTNAARLAVYAIRAQAPPALIAERRMVTRLGAGTVRKNLSEPAMRRALAAARRLAAAARRLRAPLTAVATAAVRDCANRAEFRARFHAAAGVPLQIISGRREARLIYRALSGSIPADPPTLMLDIGGGSTELIVGTSTRICAAISLPLGAVRLAEIFPRITRSEPIPGAVYRKMQRYIRQAAGARITTLRRHGAIAAIGVGGATGAIAAMLAARHSAPAADAAGPTLAADLPDRLAEQLRRLPLAQRRCLPGMTPDRADIILAGIAILAVILRDLRIRRLRISRCGLRDGLLAEIMPTGGRHPPPAAPVRRPAAVRASPVIGHARRHPPPECADRIPPAPHAPSRNAASAGWLPPAR